jgi:hypothetical protein
MKLRLMGTEDECARVAFLLRLGPPELQVLQVDGPYPNRGGSRRFAPTSSCAWPASPARSRGPSTAWPVPTGARCWSTPGAPPSALGVSADGRA